MFYCGPWTSDLLEVVRFSVDYGPWTVDYFMMHSHKRIGIFGGTFDPVHKGHIYVALRAVKSLRLDRLYFVPAYIPPHKKISGDASAKERLAMVRAAIRGNSAFCVSAFEVKMKGRSYSVRTIRYFRKRFGKRTVLFFIIGADSLKGLAKWKDINDDLCLANFAVVSRPGYRMKGCPYKLTKLKCEGVDVSSSGIRRALRDGKNVSGSIPEKVYSFILENNLYGAGR